MRISDWSSDVCSSDLFPVAQIIVEGGRGDRRVAHRDADLIERHNDIARRIDAGDARALLGIDDDATIVAQIEIGRAHVCPVTTAHLVCRLLLEKKKLKLFYFNYHSITFIPHTKSQ